MEKSYTYIIEVDNSLWTVIYYPDTYEFEEISLIFEDKDCGCHRRESIYDDLNEDYRKALLQAHANYLLNLSDERIKNINYKTRFQKILKNVKKR